VGWWKRKKKLWMRFSNRAWILDASLSSRCSSHPSKIVPSLAKWSGVALIWNQLAKIQCCITQSFLQIFPEHENVQYVFDLRPNSRKRLVSAIGSTGRRIESLSSTVKCMLKSADQRSRYLILIHRECCICFDRFYWVNFVGWPWIELPKALKK